MGSEESALKDKTEPLQTTNEEKYKFCMCDKSKGKCKREKHKEGQLCDRRIKIGGNDRHIICKMCRSEKKKLPVVEKQELLILPTSQTNKKLNSFSQSDAIYNPDGRPRKIDEKQDQKDFDISGLTLGFSKGIKPLGLSKGIKQYTGIDPVTRHEVRYQQCNCSRSKGKCYNDNHEHGVPCENFVKITRNERHLVCKTCRCATKKIKDKNDAELLLSVSENLSAGSIIASLSEKLKLDSRE